MATLMMLAVTAFVAGLARGFSGFGAALIFVSAVWLARSDNRKTTVSAISSARVMRRSNGIMRSTSARRRSWTVMGWLKAAELAASVVRARSRKRDMLLT
mgnify:CR=1 FL=1